MKDDDLKDLKEDDPRRVKRIIANRQSAQRSRMRKLQYTEELEKSVQRLHTEINQLMPQVCTYAGIHLCRHHNTRGSADASP